MIRRLLVATVATLAMGSPTLARAQAVLYTSNFLATDAATWTVNIAPTANAAQQAADFGFDYSAFGIPAAPGSADTIGLRLRANVPGTAAAPVTTRPGGAISGLSVSPTGQNFGTAYRVTFYAWSNFNGAPNASGLADNANSEGGTNNVMFAVGTSGTVPLVVGNTGLAAAPAGMDGIGFATTGDGGITNDYRVYPKSGTFTPATTPGVYNAGSNSNTATLYATAFPAVSAPAIQQTLSTAEYGLDASNTQAGSTQVGAFGFAWHKITMTTDGTTAQWAIDNALIATLDETTLGGLGGNNLALGESDVNTSTTRHPSLLFTVFDNLTVTSLPEPSSFAFIGLAVPALLRLRRRRKA
jgi:hypothetical protein